MRQPDFPVYDDPELPKYVDRLKKPFEVFCTTPSAHNLNRKSPPDNMVNNRVVVGAFADLAAAGRKRSAR